MSGPSSRARVREVVEPAVARAGYDLEDISVTPAGKRRLVRVIIDRDGGVDLDHAAEISRELSELLDAAGAMGESPYVLEVSSPGVDRPLTEPRHWRRAAGRLVSVTVDDGATLTARVTGADDEGVFLAADGEPTHYAYGRLGKGRVQVEFRRDSAVAADESADESADEGDDG